MPRTAVMNCPRNELFTGAGFAKYQHRNFGAAYEIDSLHHRREASRFANDRFAAIAAAETAQSRLPRRFRSFA